MFAQSPFNIFQQQKSNAPSILTCPLLSSRVLTPTTQDSSPNSPKFSHDKPFRTRFSRGKVTSAIYWSRLVLKPKPSWTDVVVARTSPEGRLCIDLFGQRAEPLCYPKRRSLTSEYSMWNYMLTFTPKPPRFGIYSIHGVSGQERDIACKMIKPRWPSMAYILAYVV